MNSNVTACPWYLCPWSLNELMAKITDKEQATYSILYNYSIPYFIELYAVSIGVYKLVLVKLMRPICSLYSIQIKKNIDEERNCHTVLLTSSQGLGMSR